MFVTSKRCFINILAQFMTPKQLLEATYYISDVGNTAGRRLSFDKEVVYHDDGTFEIKTKTNTVGSSITRFNIIYSEGFLDPAQAINKTSANAIGSSSHRQLVSKTPEEVYIEHLKNPTTILGAKDWLYGSLNTRNKNGVRIFIINDEENARNFGHITCLFLSKYFGEDINFIDAQYRPQIVKGRPVYQGDKEFSKKIFHDINDYGLMTKISSLISQGGFDLPMNNLLEFLSTLDVPTLFYVYERLFPSEPLPAGNYSTEQIKTIIVGKCADKIGVVYPSRETSLNTIDLYMDQLDAQLEDFNDCF